MSPRIQIRFGQAIRRVRNARGISQEQFAHDSGLDRSYVGGIERGERNPSLLAIEKIALGLKISLAELFAECAGTTKGRRTPEQP
jgi:transcriptional regulator with XRE-family HTH domain